MNIVWKKPEGEADKELEYHERGSKRMLFERKRQRKTYRRK